MYFRAVGLKSVTVFPTTKMKKLAYIDYWNKVGSMIGRDHLMRKQLVVEASKQNNVFNSAGTGCFANPSDYTRKSYDVRLLRRKLARFPQKS